MADRTAVAAGGTGAHLIDGNGVPICAGGGSVVYLWERTA